MQIVQWENRKRVVLIVSLFLAAFFNNGSSIQQFALPDHGLTGCSAIDWRKFDARQKPLQVDLFIQLIFH